MKRVLIATTNKDKYAAVSEIFKNTIFPENDYLIEKLTNDINLPDENDVGNNIVRARNKTINAYNHLKEYNYDYIVGLDDAIFIKGKLEPNIKNYLNKILYEGYLEEGEEYSFNRAYCIIDKNEKLYETNIYIPYIYRSLKEDYTIVEQTYQLSKVAYPIGYDKPICELSPEEEIKYYLKFVKEGILSLNIKNTNN